MDIDQFFAKFNLPEDFTKDLDKVWLYKKNFPKEGYTLSLRPVCLKKDIPRMHRWASHPYAKKFWQMEYSEHELYEYYLKMLRKNLAFAFLLYLNEIPVAQTDIYQVVKDEISAHYNASTHDYGLHLLMSPYKEIMSGISIPLKNLSIHVLMTIIHFLFSFEAVKRIVVEPDKENKAANLLAQKAGFQFMKEIQLSYKKANLYSYKRADFLKKYP